MQLKENEEEATYHRNDGYLFLMLPGAVRHEVSVDVAHPGARHPLYPAPTLPNLHTIFTNATLNHGNFKKF
jgi:hypothetical protein